MENFTSRKIIFLFSIIIVVLICVIIVISIPKIILPLPPSHSTPLGCEIYTSAQHPQDPLVLDETIKNFVYSAAINASISLSQGSKIYIGCPGGRLNTSTPDGIYICQKGTQLKSPDGVIVDFNATSCSMSVSNVSTTVKVKKLPSESRCGYDLLDIGYQLDEKNFLKIFTICFDPNASIPLYSQFTLSQYVQNGDNSIERPSFFENSGLYYQTWNLDNVYKWTIQSDSLKTLLPFPLNDSSYWNRGHLTANADFVRRFQRYATFAYLNVAPQWITFNSGDWSLLEEAVRNSIANKDKTDAEVYTGTWGSAGMSPTNPFILDDGDKSHRMPIPKWFWKYVKSPSLQNYVFVGYNNPFIDRATVESELKSELCTAKQDLTKILQTNFPGPPTGYLYVCDKGSLVSDFKSNISKL